jgi:hypothetical protein
VTDVRAVLSVDAVAFRPVVTVDEGGRVRGFKGLNQLESPDLFSQFLTDPDAFVSFLRNHWRDAYSAMFVFQLQPVSPEYPCSILHVIPDVSGKGRPEIVDKLRELKADLEDRFGFKVVGLAFDGDSCFNPLHEEFRTRWTQKVLFDSLHVPLDIPDCAAICDPLDLLKRIRYRWVLGALSIGVGPDDPTTFSLENIQGWRILSPVVFLNSHITKMHDSLPLRLFSPATFKQVLERGPSPEHVLAPWCLLVTALTLVDITVTTRIDLLAIGFWFLFLYSERLQTFGYPHGVSESKRTGVTPSLYSRQQVRDALNTFVSLISILTSAGPDEYSALDRLGSGPLEHFFGRARIRCRDVNTMARMIEAFATEAWGRTVDSVLSLTAEPRHRACVGVHCGPCVGSLPSPFQWTPKSIAASLLEQTGLVIGPVVTAEGGFTDAWRDLLKISCFATDRPDSRPARRIDPQRKERTRVLSSNQIFLGIISSPRPFTLMTAPVQMGRSLEPPLVAIETRLMRMFGEHRLTRRELETRVRAAAPWIDARPPEGRKRRDLLEWLHGHWHRVERFLVMSARGRHVNHGSDFQRN